MTRDGTQSRDVTHWIRERQLQRVQQNPHRPLFGNAWGLRGGKPYTGNGNPLNGLPNGRPFQDSSNAPNGVGFPPRNRDRTFRRFLERSDETRDFSRGRSGGYCSSISLMSVSKVARISVSELMVNSFRRYASRVDPCSAMISS